MVCDFNFYCVTVKTLYTLKQLLSSMSVNVLYLATSSLYTCVCDQTVDHGICFFLMELFFFSPWKGYFCIPVREGNIARAYVGCRSMKRVGTGGSQFISMLASKLTVGKPVYFAVKNWFMLSVRRSSYGCTRKVWRARKKRKSCSRQIAESNSSFLSALQTSQVHP